MLKVSVSFFTFLLLEGGGFTSQGQSYFWCSLLGLRPVFFSIETLQWIHSWSIRVEKSRLIAHLTNLLILRKWKLFLSQIVGIVNLRLLLRTRMKTSISYARDKDKTHCYDGSTLWWRKHTLMTETHSDDRNTLWLRKHTLVKERHYDHGNLLWWRKTQCDDGNILRC